MADTPKAIEEAFQQLGDLQRSIRFNSFKVSVLSSRRKKDGTLDRRFRAVKYFEAQKAAIPKED